MIPERRKFHAFFDESGTHDGSPFVCVAAVLIPDERMRSFSDAWLAMLSTWGLKAFHMTDCNSERGEFKALNAQQCDQAARDAIHITKQHAEFWTAASIDARAHQLVGADGIGLSAYVLASAFCMLNIKDWRASSTAESEITYTFESGVSEDRLVDRALTRIFSDVDSRSQYGYLSHSYQSKISQFGLQASDIYAWHWFVDSKRFERSQHRRPDFLSLGDVPHIVSHFDDEALALVRKALVT